MADAAGAILAITSLLLLGFGLNLLHLTRLAFRTPEPPPAPVPPGSEALVCVQLPIYNERHVAERVIDAACSLDWPRRLLEIQVLDDSDDDTAATVAGAAGRWRARGVHIVHLRRPLRSGYKAGALAAGVEASEASFFAVFDSDFVPGPDFLRRSMGAFDDPLVGFVQARWGHLNEGYSWLTRMQALAIDFHFLIEQTVRSRGFFTNFTGTAGIWRREAIAAAGGWSADTLTEDLDLSYRAQLAGWRPRYLETLVVPEELPVEVQSYRRQQSRWATGSFQTARKLIRPVLDGPFPAAVKWQACMHLLAYGVGPLMLLQLACYPFLVLAQARHQSPPGLGGFGLAVNLVSIAPWIGFMAAQVRRGRPWWHGLPAGLCQLLGAGLALTTLAALARSLRSGGEFVRTPKYRIVAPGQEWRGSSYVRIGSPAALLEFGVGAGAALLSLVAVRWGMWLVAVYSALFAAGLLSLSLLSVAEAIQILTLRRLGGGALGRLRGAGPAALLLVLPAVLLGSVALIGEPFEDGYQHWLMAAILAETGHLRDPLFGMQDTWLPGYQLLAAGLLKLFGLWNLAVLRLGSVALALGSLLLLARLAPTRAQGRLAVWLTVLNPIFLLTSTSAVAEPLLLFLLLGATAAALAGRAPLAGLLFAAACLTGTKAWVWVLALAGIQLAWELRRPAAGRSQRAAWLVPALAVLVVLQLGFAPASHSVARAATEAASAAARAGAGTVPPAPLPGFVWWFALASLPVLALAPVGLVREARRAGGADRLRLLHLPSLGYLGAILVLAGAGAYTGSHRYYLLGLPALALLAAAALEGRRPAALIAVASAGLITLGYIPVFTSFAGGNAPLVAAGESVASIPGRLLTDSPVAAYASHKDPAGIAGSAVLPAGPAEALAWLGRQGFTSLVVERIDYYRATVVFPELARGGRLVPFQEVGAAASPRSPAGKEVHAYRLDPAVYEAPLIDGLGACLDPRCAPGQGKTAELEKGVILERGALAMAGGGTGFGVPIARFEDGWHFPGSATATVRPDPGARVWVKVFDLDRIEVDDAQGRFLRFQRAPSRGRIQVTYRLQGARIEISVNALDSFAGAGALVILNEQSAAFDDLAFPSGTLLGDAIGSWSPVAGEWARFRSGDRQAEWSLPAVGAAQLFAARELLPPAIDFSGLEYWFGPGFSSTAYAITVGRSR